MELELLEELLELLEDELELLDELDDELELLDELELPICPVELLLEDELLLDEELELLLSLPPPHALKNAIAPIKQLVLIV